jgi:mediator of RNA polymerase II transcription subunit 13
LVDLNKRQISATFLILDTDPLLDFPVQEATNRIAELASGSLTTPGATPQSNAASPDISGFGTTPGGPPQVSTPPPSTAFTEHDVEARLIDMSDETWGVLMNSPSEVSSLSKSANSDSCPALASGYLIKRAGPRDEDGLTRVGIKLLHGQTGHRTVLKEVLGMYGGLALLARARAIGNAETRGLAKGVLPYHVAAARKAHAAVSATMRYGDG